MPPCRFPDVDAAALEATIARSGELLTRFATVDDPRNFEPFLQRGRSRFALGAPISDVVLDLRLAARAFSHEIGVRLFKVEKHRLKLRRIDPIHLALLVPDPAFVERVAKDAGLPLMTVYAGAAERALEEEVLPMSPFFSARRLRGPADVTGLAAASYASALAALARGDDREARGVLRILAGAVNDLESEPPVVARRYLHLCAAVSAVVSRTPAVLVQELVALVPYGIADREQALVTDRAGVIERGDGAPDLAIPALVALAALVNLEVDLAPLRDADVALHELTREVRSGWDRLE